MKYIALGLFITITTASFIVSRLLYHKKLRDRPKKRQKYLEMIKKSDQ